MANKKTTVSQRPKPLSLSSLILIIIFQFDLAQFLVVTSLMSSHPPSSQELHAIDGLVLSLNDVAQHSVSLLFASTLH
jgi:hypothetical protein